MFYCSNINYNEIRKEHMKEAVIHCIELKGLKNPQNVELLENGIYKFTNTLKRSSYYVCLPDCPSYLKYEKSNSKNIKKLHKVLGFYIAELFSIKS